MGEQSFLDRMLSHLRSTSKYYTGYPKDLGPSRVVHFTSERQFVQLLHEGRPVVVAFTIKCPYARHLDEVLEEAAAEFYPHIKFMRVECPKYPGFCITRQKKDYPFIEVFYNPEQCPNKAVSSLWRGINHTWFPAWTWFSQSAIPAILRNIRFFTCLSYFLHHSRAANEGRVVDPNITKYAVKVLPYTYDQSAYGFREFFKRHKMMHAPDSK